MKGKKKKDTRNACEVVFSLFRGREKREKWKNAALRQIREKCMIRGKHEWIWRMFFCVWGGRGEGERRVQSTDLPLTLFSPLSTFVEEGGEVQGGRRALSDGRREGGLRLQLIRLLLCCERPGRGVLVTDTVGVPCLCPPACLSVSWGVRLCFCGLSLLLSVCLSLSLFRYCWMVCVGVEEWIVFVFSSFGVAFFILAFFHEGYIFFCVGFLRCFIINKKQF